MDDFERAAPDLLAQVRCHQNPDAHSFHHGALDRLSGVALHHHVGNDAQRFDVLKQVLSISPEG